jgi:hypothetical protein
MNSPMPMARIGSIRVNPVRRTITAAVTPPTGPSLSRVGALVAMILHRGNDRRYRARDRLPDPDVRPVPGRSPVSGRGPSACRMGRRSL